MANVWATRTLHHLGVAVAAKTARQEELRVNRNRQLRKHMQYVVRKCTTARVTIIFGSTYVKCRNKHERLALLLIWPVVNRV